MSFVPQLTPPHQNSLHYSHGFLGGDGCKQIASLSSRGMPGKSYDLMESLEERAHTDMVSRAN